MKEETRSLLTDFLKGLPSRQDPAGATGPGTRAKQDGEPLNDRELTALAAPYPRGAFSLVIA